MLSTFKPALDPVIADFEKAYPAIHVNVQYVPPGTSYPDTLTTEINGGNAPDVFYTNPGYVQMGSASLLTLAKDGKVADLTSQSWSGDVPQIARSGFELNGKVYGLPLGGASSGLIYNETEFAKLGLKPPTTFSGVLQLCRTIKADGKIPIALPGQFGAFLPLSLAMSSVYVTNPDWDSQLAAGKTTFAGTAGWQTAMQEVSQMNSAGCFQPGAVSSTTSQAFQLAASGQALMYAGPTGALGALQAPGVTFGAFPIAAGSTTSTRVMSAFGDAMAVTAGSAHEAAAIQFVDYLAGPDVATPLANKAGDISVAQANSGQLPTSMTAFASYFQQDKTVAFPSWLGAGQLVSLSTAVQQVLNGGQGSVTSALQGVDRSLQS